MKRVVLFSIFILLAVFAIAQQVTDSTASVTYTFGDSALQFLTKNMWTLIFVAFTIISEWLGQTNKVKEGSIWAWVINQIGKILKSKTDVVKSKKAKYLVLLVCLLSTTAISAQKFEGFFQPVKKQMFDEHVKALDVPANSVWLFRPAVEITAMKLAYDKTAKQWNTSSMTQAGIGIGYQHYVLNEGVPFNNFGFNLLCLFDAIPSETTSTGISLAGTVGILKLLDFGGGYSFSMKQPFILTGIKYNF
jgi:hypothetical protein